MTIFSIIIPVYNVIGYIESTLDSVLAQTYSNWECICIDDGSCDGSESILDKYAKNDSRFKVFHQENGGVSCARNNGIKKSTSEWIWFVDGDDLIHPQALEMLASQIETHQEVDLWYFNFIHNKKIEFKNIKCMPKIDIYTDYNNIPEMSMWRCICKRALIKNLRFQNFKMGEDLLFFAKQLILTKKIGHINEIFYGYVNRESSICNCRNKTRTIDSLHCMEQFLIFLENDGSALNKKIKKMRWNRFLFAYPYGIRKYPKDDFYILMDLWFEILNNLDFAKTNIVQTILRKTYCFLGKNNMLKQIIFFINASIIELRK